jgi:hypothetical protein
MAYDITQPTDTAKIRDLGVVIRPNWQAIQEADSTFLPKAINFNNRTVSGPTNDPAAITNAFIMYSKEDALGNAELFGINESSQIIQFTRGNSTIADVGECFIPGGLMLKWGNATLSNNNAVYSYASAFPTNTIGVFLTQLSSTNVEDSQAYATAYTTTGFTARRYGPNSRIYKYLALGY